MTDRTSFFSAAATMAVLFLFGVAVNLYFGRIGYMPLDQGIVFDGAWRMMTGQIPFRDFAAPNAMLPAVMQVPFFRLLGVTWFAFVLHASIINGLFSVASYVLLRTCGATRVEAALFGALGAFFLYPTNGTPFMDQHAFFFTTLMFLAVVTSAVETDARSRARAWATVPGLFVLAYLSKQIPTAFAAVCIAAWALAGRRRIRESLVPLLGGFAAVIGAVALLGFVLHVDWRYAVQYLIVMPLDTGAERTTGHGPAAPLRLVLGTLRRIPVLLNLWSFDLTVVAMILMPIGFRRASQWRIRAWLLWSIALTTAAFVAYTINQVQDALALAMLAAGLTAVTAREGAALLPVMARTRQWIASGAVAMVALAAARDTWRFAADVDATRLVLDTQYVADAADRAEGHLPTALSFLRWTDVGAYDARQLTALVQYLHDAPGDFVLIGDSTLLYGLTGKPSVSPALWLHPGLSVPRPGTAAFESFESTLIGRFESFDVRRLVVEGVRTLRGIALADFPRLTALAETDSCGETWFGSVRIVEFCGNRKRQ